MAGGMAEACHDDFRQHCKPLRDGLIQSLAFSLGMLKRGLDVRSEAIARKRYVDMEVGQVCMQGCT